MLSYLCMSMTESTDSKAVLHNYWNEKQRVHRQKVKENKNKINREVKT
jgi:hypothetical protein